MLDKPVEAELKQCGIVMPISECDGCSEEHWKDVADIIKRSAVTAGFAATLVSEADDVGVIQKRIVQNLYSCPVVVCDVSGRNANVMFELGMRLAFDKPTVVIIDDKTPFSFDTSPLEHLTYPRDLRFSKIEAFQEALSRKISSVFKSDGNASFLKSFGSFKVADLSVEQAPISEVVLEEVLSMKKELRNLRASAGVIDRRQRDINFSSKMDLGKLNEFIDYKNNKYSFYYSLDGKEINITELEALLRSVKKDIHVDSISYNVGLAHFSVDLVVKKEAPLAIVDKIKSNLKYKLAILLGVES